MARRRWIADEVSGSHAALLGPHADHLVRVLRAREGQEFEIATPEGVRLGRITGIREGRVEFELGEMVPAVSLPEITMALSIFKFDRMEWAIEKCVELGASRIIPVVARRTETHLAAAAPKRVERWQRISRQAAEQSRREHPAEILQPIKFLELLEQPGDCRIVLSEAEKGIMLADLIHGGGLTLAIGPEGGWTESELEGFSGAGWLSASLGATILRAETAAISALAVALSRA